MYKVIAIRRTDDKAVAVTGEYGSYDDAVRIADGLAAEDWHGRNEYYYVVYAGDFVLKDEQ